MPFAVLFLIVIGGLLVAWLYPHLRVVALAASALFGGMFAVYLLTTDFNPDTAETRIAADEVEFSDLVLTEQRLSATLTGRVSNLSERFILRQVDLTVTLYDCEVAEAEPETCVIIAQDTAPARVAVPPGQVRAFEAAFGFPNRPAVDGVLVWRHTVAGTRGTEP